MAEEQDDQEVERKKMVEEIHDLLSTMSATSPAENTRNERVRNILSKAAGMLETPRETKRRESGAA